MRLGIELVRKGVVSAEDFLEAADRQIKSRVPVGRLALENRKLSVRQVTQILRNQADDPRPFGELAVDGGFLSRQEVAFLLMLQLEQVPSFEEILVEMGALDRDTMQQEIAAAQETVAFAADPCMMV